MNPLPTPQQLRYLVTLAEMQHFGRAASACAVTQSTLSAGLFALERQLDAALLDRSAGKRVVLTPLGMEVVARAHSALAALEAVCEQAAAARAPMTGRLRLGVIPTIGPFLLPRLMPALRSAFPNLRLALREDTTQRCLDRLNAGKLDLVLLALPCACAGSATLPIARDAFVAALPPGSLAAAERVSPEQLAAEPLLLLEDGHCLRDQVLAACIWRGCPTMGRTVSRLPACTRWCTWWQADSARPCCRKWRSRPVLRQARICICGRWPAAARGARSGWPGGPTRRANAIFARWRRFWHMRWLG